MMTKEQELRNDLDYLELILRVARIDEDASDYMQTEMRTIEGFQTGGDLWEVVVWNFTKQGTDYWYDIACKLDEQ